MQHGTQPEQPAAEQENQSAGNISNPDNGMRAAASAGSGGQTKQASPGHAGCH